MQKIKLRSSDGEIFSTDIQIASCSGTLKTMFEVCGMEADERVVPLPNVDSTTLRNVLIWATYHKDDLQPIDEISSWDADFLKLNKKALLQLVLAADYLDIKGLLNVATKAIANMIKGKNPLEIIQTFDIMHDSAALEEMEIQQITLQSSDGEIFNVEMQIAECFGNIKTRLELCSLDEHGNFVVPLPDIHSSIFRKVLTWAKHHKDDPLPTKCKEDIGISSWDADFLKVDQGTLFELVKAAYYLKITGLLDVIREALRNRIFKNSNIKQDSTAIDEEQIVFDIFSNSKMEKFQLLSADGDIFNVDMHIALCFGTVRTMVRTDWNLPVPLPTIHSSILRKVLIFAKYHITLSQPIVNDGYIALWYVKFLNVDTATRFKLRCAAKDLDIDDLLELIDKVELYEVKDKPTWDLEDSYKIDFDCREHLEFMSYLN